MAKRRKKLDIVIGTGPGPKMSSRAHNPRSAQKAMQREQFARDMSRFAFGSSNAFGRGQGYNKEGGKISSYYKKGGNVITGR
tara:strand:+ start:93 stop:338 length:246 start_codon:yes stop_codon:yes gene_type:complete